MFSITLRTSAGYLTQNLGHALQFTPTPAPVALKALDILVSQNRQISLSSVDHHLWGDKGPWKVGTRKMKGKHYLPQWKPLRRMKVIRIKLPNFREMSENNNLTPDQMRSKMKEAGVVPPTPWVERQFEVSSTGAIFDAYVPPEGDGKASIISPSGAKQTAVDLTKKSKTMLAIRKIKQFEEGFNRSDFLEQALDIYKKMHEVMAKAGGVPDVDLFERDLAQYVTEKAYPEIVHNLKCKTIRWKFLESLEPPRLVRARCENVLTNENMFGQVTVRLHTKQTLAIYDRFGRLMFGNELTPKDVLEYVVFEKHLADTYGCWRVHAKIIPEWSGTGHNLMPVKTVRKSPPPPPTAAAPKKEKEATVTPPPPESAETKTAATPHPQVALA